ncbi:MAG: hypothetical protein HGB14_03380 [Anaerolineaceae bacterium]|nr:hypothetical protein [Anaerolineaceae bacterium]
MQLKYLFEKAGFRDIKIESATGFFSMITLKVNYFSLRFIKGPKILKKIIYGMLIPLWYFNQNLALIIDNLDKHKQLESIGYWVVAKKLNK